MADYISREAAKKFFLNLRDSLPSFSALFIPEEVVGYLDEIPAAGVMPVVHGRWVTHYRSGTTVAEGYVSTCCDMWNSRKSDYCPTCGARMDMDGGEEDEWHNRL